jgi:hypothetical protein
VERVMSNLDSDVSIKLNDQEYTGGWYIDSGGMIRVSYGSYSSGPVRLGGHYQTPIVLARILLRELVVKAHKDNAA